MIILDVVVVFPYSGFMLSEAVDRRERLSRRGGGGREISHNHLQSSARSASQLSHTPQRGKRTPSLHLLVKMYFAFVDI